MTRPTDDCLYPQPKSGQAVHTQESGDAGLSSKMEHRFSDDYNESTLPALCKGSLVRPIPKEDLEMSECPGTTGEVVPCRPAFEPPAASKSESHQPLGVTQEGLCPNKLRAQATPLALLKRDQAGETVDMFPGTTVATEGELDFKLQAGDGCVDDSGMDAGGNSVKPEGPLLVPKDTRDGKHSRKRMERKNWKLFLLAFALIVPASAAFTGTQAEGDKKFQCFTCVDKEQCSKLVAIYDAYDKLLFYRDFRQPFPQCSAVSSPFPKSCSVCSFQANIIISCPQDAGTLDMEASDGSHILNISTVCEHQQPSGHAHAGMIPSESTMAISVQCPTKRYVVILFQPVTLTCNYQSTATQPPVVTWKYKSYCRDPIQAALNPSSAENILSQNNPNYDANIECADSLRTVRIVASKQGNAVSLGSEYQGRKISIINNADLNIAQTAWGDSGVYVCSVISSQDLSGNSEDYTELIVLDWLLVVLVVFGFLLLLLLIGICWCQCCPHTCCCYISCPCCPDRCCCPRALYEAGKAVKKGGSNLYAPTLYAPSMYAQPAYSGHLLNQPSMPMLPLPNGAGPPPSQNGYGRDYDGASSVGQGSQVPLLHEQDGGGDHTRSGYRIQVDPDGNATRAIYYMERELAKLDPSRSGNFNRMENMSEVSSLHDGLDPRGRGGGRSQPPPLATVYDRDEAMSTISSVSQQGHRRDDYPRHGGGFMGERARARSMENLDNIGRRYNRDNSPHREPRGRRGSDDEWSTSARGGYDRDFDDRRRRDYSPDDHRRGAGAANGGLSGRRSRSRDDLMDLEKNRQYGGGATRGKRDDYDDNFLREAMERKKKGEQQRGRSREHLDSESDRSDRGRAPRGAPPLPVSPPSGYPARRDDYLPPPPPPPYSEDESMSSKKSNLRKNGAVSRESLVV
uniref:Ig-like domain-containing protein n=1 Tax=Scophthalmus maximus TaxID=52904 RepID=A0A8D2ZTU6_SCOMX